MSIIFIIRICMKHTRFFLYEQITENNKQTCERMGKKFISWHIVKHAHARALTHTHSQIRWNKKHTMYHRNQNHSTHISAFSVGCRGGKTRRLKPLWSQKCWNKSFICVRCSSLFHSWWLLFSSCSFILCSSVCIPHYSFHDACSACRPSCASLTFPFKYFAI